MAEHFITRLQKKLTRGFTLERVQSGAGMGVYEVHDPKGNPVYDDSGAPIRFGDRAMNMKGIESTLRRRGAIPPPKPRNPKPRAAAVDREKTRTNPLLMAGEILRDPNATPRERRMANSYLQLSESHKEVRLLVGKLGKALKRYQKGD